MVAPSTSADLRRSRGFTVLEMAVTVSVLGVLAVTATSLANGYVDVRARARAQADAEVARQAVLGFVLQHKRLPCPDLSAAGEVGREGVGGACPAGAQVGWLPYESLGLPRPEAGRRMRYAVARNAAGADLVAPTGAGTDFDGIARLRATLLEAASQAPASHLPYLTGRGTPADPESCGHVATNPAFVVVAPVNDRDDTASTYPGFDGVNRAMADSGAYCIASPGRAMDANYDDVVLAESANALLGRVAATAR